LLSSRNSLDRQELPASPDWTASLDLKARRVFQGLVGLVDLLVIRDQGEETVETDCLVPWAPEATWASQALKGPEARLVPMVNQDREDRRDLLVSAAWAHLARPDPRAHEGYKGRRDPLDRPEFPCEDQTGSPAPRARPEAQELRELQAQQVLLDPPGLLELLGTSNNIIKGQETESARRKMSGRSESWEVVETGTRST